MHISKIHLKNIRCFEDIEIDLKPGNTVQQWTVILGNNSVGKTTLLRSIAVGLCDRTSAAGLISEHQGEWVRKNSIGNTGSIEIELEDPKLGYTTSTKVEIVNNAGRETIKGFDSPTEGSPKEEIFVCAYGTGRGFSGTRDYPKYRTIDSVFTLFDYEMNLQNSELVLRRIQSNGVNIKEFLELIDEILMLSPGSTELSSTGITISGPWGKYMPLGSVGDGYRSTLAWIVDFLGWALFQQENILRRDDIAGIILVDELEQHLHPTWQRNIIRIMQSQFPKTQFLATSHSPLCASGLADLDDEICELVLLASSEEEGPVTSEIITSLLGLRADQVLTSKAFGLLETRNTKIEEKLEEFRGLFLNESLDAGEKEEFETVRNFIEDNVPGLADSEEDRQLEQRLRDRLNEFKHKGERPNND